VLVSFRLRLKFDDSLGHWLDSFEFQSPNYRRFKSAGDGVDLGIAREAAGRKVDWSVLSEANILNLH
jgi:hypothetical protein